jgi:hypothetical protein
VFLRAATAFRSDATRDPDETESIIQPSPSLWDIRKQSPDQRVDQAKRNTYL